MGIPTMQISGNKYAQVKDRVAAFHKMYKAGIIGTSYEIMDGMVAFEANIWKTAAGTKPSATGHALGKLTGGKTFEKTETIAVGRALAFLGIMADGSIACAEEMEDVNWDIQETDEYKNASYQLEDLLERCNIEDPSVENIRRNYGNYDINAVWAACKFLRGLMDEQRVGSGNTTAKERQQQVGDKLEDEKS